MTATKNVYVLMLALVIVLSGCFGNTSDGVDADSDESTTIVNNFYNNTEDEWFTQGGIIDTQWFGPEGIWLSANSSACSYLGGTLETVPDTPTVFFPEDNKTVCDIYLGTIDTTAGEMLQVHEWYGISMNTTCDGSDVTILNGWTHGSSMDCVHEFFMNDVDWTNTNQTVDQLWSITYSIKTVTVVP